MQSKYKIYFYSQPHFLILSENDIIDINLKEDKGAKLIEISYNDVFFHLNLKYSKSKEWSLIIHSFDEKGNFDSQIDVYGENLKFKKNKDGKIILFEYEQITNNKAWGSIPRAFEEAEKNYVDLKCAYNRNQSIQKILD